MNVKFNINDIVRVKLTEHGKLILRQKWHEVFKNNPAWIKAHPYTDHEEDEDGWSEWQFWVLMQHFGEHIGLAMPLCFEQCIEFVIEDD